MAEYIEKNVAIARLTALEIGKTCATMTDAKRQIADTRPADVALVVRCKNCRSYNKPKTGWCEVHLDREHPDDFCSYGKRKDGEI